MVDPSNGYDAAADLFISRRSAVPVGVATVMGWARALPAGAAVLDIGCGSGVPIAQALAAEGFRVYGVDASPRMIAAFRAHVPHAISECSAVENSNFFDRSFGGAIAWGVLFLLAPDVQAQVIRKVAAVLEPGGRFLFTAPAEACEWMDVLTGRKSVSLGSDRYRQLIGDSGLTVSGDARDEGDNYYFFAERA